MDYLSAQQAKEALDDAIYRMVMQFERETGKVVTGITVRHMDNHCTSVSTRTQMWR